MGQIKSAKILLVDDEPNILVPIEFLMQQQGFEVRKAFSGQEALDILPGYKPDVVVLDVMMPGMDGFEVAKRIRKLPGLRHTRILFLTAKGAEEDRMKGYSTGGEVYMTKPFDNDELIQIVAEVLEFG
ncbi:MAG: response regulator [Saprospirales bacterium]|nr:response regulator [Saprospirales bacterium]MBK8493384.1 response regulator [Saprospirales bacterium]